MRHSASHCMATALMTVAAVSGCNGSHSTQVSNGVLAAQLPGTWAEQYDPAGQRLIALGPLKGERLEAMAICRAGRDPVEMSRRDVERYLEDQLRVQMSDVHWHEQGV